MSVREAQRGQPAQSKGLLVSGIEALRGVRRHIGPRVPGTRTLSSLAAGDGPTCARLGLCGPSPLGRQDGHFSDPNRHDNARKPEALA